MKTLIDFALKEEYKCLQSVGDKLAEIDPLIDWKPFRIIFEFIYFNKNFSEGRSEADVVIMLKILFLQQLHCLSDFEIEKKCIDEYNFQT